MKKILTITALVILISGCAPGPKKMSMNMNSASLGMTKQEVINTMGPPQSISAISGTEYLIYKLCTVGGGFMDDFRCRRWEDFYVRLKAGKVESYGKKGDFDSTKTPETKNTIDLNINHK